MVSPLTSPNASSLRFSVLDQSPMAADMSAGQALRNSIDLAQFTESLGYHRYWVAEHHATPALACTSPEVLIGPIAAATSRIRVGSGGIMLPHYSSLKVAETFSMLSELYPGRIDLGLGRAPGTDQTTAFQLQRDRRQRSPDDFPDQLTELLEYLSKSDPRRAEGLPQARRHWLPNRSEMPAPYLLGSSPASGAWAANFGLPYVFADFISPTGVDIAAYYRSTFKPSKFLEKPETIVAAWIVCAETDDAAHRLASSFKMLMTQLLRGRLIPVPPIDEAMAFLAEQGLPPDYMPPGRRAIVGSPETVKPQIESLMADYGADELLAVNILHDHAARRRSHELLAGLAQNISVSRKSPTAHFVNS